MARILANVSFVCLVLSIAFLIIATVLFFAFQIPDVVDDLSGKKARRAIANKKANNQKNNNKLSAKNKKQILRQTNKTLTSSEATLPLDSEATLPLNSEATLPLDNEATMMLDEATQILGTYELDCKEQSSIGNKDQSSKFEIIEEVMLIHTDEKIK